LFDEIRHCPDLTEACQINASSLIACFTEHLICNVDTFFRKYYIRPEVSQWVTGKTVVRKGSRWRWINVSNGS